MVYQIPKDGIANNAVTSLKILNSAVITDKILNGAVTLPKLGSDAKRFPILGSTPITANTSLTNAQVNQYIFVGYNAANPVFTLPLIADVNDGDWFSFITNEDYATAGRQVTINPGSGDSIDGFAADAGLVIDIPFSGTTLVAFDGKWYILDTQVSSQSQKVANNRRYAVVNTTSTNYTLEPGEFLSVTADGITVTLPADPLDGETVSINLAGDFQNVKVGRNGKEILGVPEDLIIDTPYATVTFIYVNSTVQWRVI